jgi:hypothetical protein
VDGKKGQSQVLVCNYQTSAVLSLLKAVSTRLQIGEDITYYRGEHQGAYEESFTSSGLADICALSVIKEQIESIEQQMAILEVHSRAKEFHHVSS